MSRGTDALVAEKILGWKRHQIPKMNCWVLCENQPESERLAEVSATPLGLVPRFTTDPAADFIILEHVREYWGLPQQAKFRNLIKEYGSMLNYRPGLWSRTALRVVEEPLMGELLPSKVVEDKL